MNHNRAQFAVRTNHAFDLDERRGGHDTWLLHHPLTQFTPVADSAVGAADHAMGCHAEQPLS